MVKAGQVALGAALAIALGSYDARADENPAPPTDSTATNPTPPAPVPTVAPTQPVPTPMTTTIAVPIPAPTNKVALEPAQPSPEASAPTDHEIVVGAIGLGYIGAARVPLPQATPVGRGDQAGMTPNDKLNLRQIVVPTLGLRKWFSKRRGIDAGLGLAISGGGTTSELGAVTANLNRETIFAMSVRAGVPLMVADTRHMAFIVVPEAALNFAASSITAEFEENAPPDAKMRGFSADVGVRAGAEVHFGFMGLPKLTLQAGVGLYMTAQWAKATVANQSLSDRSISLGFGSAGNPWDIFSGVANMSARYYF